MSSAATQLHHDPVLRLHDGHMGAGEGETTLHDRINEVVAGLSFRELGELIGQNPETVRRYVRGAEPSVAFLTALCDAFDLSAEWLLRGIGPRRHSGAVEELLRTAGYTRLLAALADRLERAAHR